MTGTARAAAAALVGVLLLAGCTSGDGSEGGQAAPAPTASSSAGQSTEPSAEQGEVDPADLSRDLLAQAAAADGALEPIASQTLEVDRFVQGTMTVVVDVLRVERRDDSTLVTIGMSSPTDPVEGARPYPTVFDESNGGAWFDRIALEDTAAGVRHYPLSWRRQVTPDLSPPDPGPLNSCVCPFRQNLHLGPEPVVMDALYGPLPEDVDTVTLWAPDGLTVPDLPVSEG
jgi:hypothetical protein